MITPAYEKEREKRKRETDRQRGRSGGRKEGSHLMILSHTLFIRNQPLGPGYAQGEVVPKGMKASWTTS